MSTQTKFTPWYVDGFGIRAMVRDSSHRIILVRHRLGGEENEQVMRHAAAAPDMYAALEALTDFTEWSFARSELYAEEFRRETGMLAPFKDAGAVANEAEELHASRAEEWRVWCKRKRETLINNARAALKRARGEG